MPFFPTEKFEIETTMTREEVVELLKSVTDKDRFWNWHWSLKPYMGKVDENGFEITETLAGITSFIIGNGFFGVAYGSFKNSRNGTVIEVEIKLNSFVRIISTFWIIVPFLFPLILLMTNWGFKDSAHGIKTSLLKIFGRGK